jgi:hypothetical protein
MPTPFITPEELKRYPLPVTDKQWAKITPEHLESVTAYATQYIEDYLDRNIFTQQYTQRIRGNNRGRLVLEQYPVTSIVSLTSTDLSGYVASKSTSDILINAGAGIIEWIDQTQNSFYKNLIWTVTYVAGYTTVPGPIKHATALQAVEMLQPLFRGGIDFQEVELITELDEAIVDMLERYKRKRIG